MDNPGVIPVKVKRISDSGSAIKSDSLAIEEPLEIRLGYMRDGNHLHRNISITMRTPGQDKELATGFLLTEGIISGKNQIDTIEYPYQTEGEVKTDNTILINLKANVVFDFKRLERHFYTTSSCGVCGKASLEALYLRECPVIPRATPVISADCIHRLPAILRERQTVFSSTGGLHAAALFDDQGNLLDLKEDVGRHNAVDKLIGAQILNENIPLHDNLMLVSGRTSFDILQKALAASIPIVAAVGAPSSLAVELANTFKITLLGFVRDERFNIYSEAQRINDMSKVQGSIRSSD
jgi:FdhD protein